MRQLERRHTIKATITATRQPDTAHAAFPEFTLEGIGAHSASGGGVQRGGVGDGLPHQLRCGCPHEKAGGIQRRFVGHERFESPGDVGLILA